jgi:hypothetical protein
MRVDDRRRGCRLGSYAYAERYGVHGCRRILEVRRSTVCDGVGLFATRFLPKDTPITYYSGWARSSERCLSERDMAYTFMLSPRSFLVGHRGMRRLLRRRGGVAQLANDSICPELTGRVNNCRFEVLDEDQCLKRKRVFLVADADIRPNEELLVDYHISYWIGMAEAVANKRNQLPEEVHAWALCQGAIQKRLTEVTGAQCIEAYHGVTSVPSSTSLSSPTRNNNDASSGVARGIATYTLFFEGGRVRPSALVDDHDDDGHREDVTKNRCSCRPSTRPRLATCEVLLTRFPSTARPDGAADATHVAWRCTRCSTMVGFQPAGSLSLS